MSASTAVPRQEGGGRHRRRGKAQVHAMVARLLPGAKIDGADAADALAVAICHAHHLATARRLAP
jgi:Holliday junction resolvasome RuvABC endonuclease subunit